jgi:hypothetical protein
MDLEPPLNEAETRLRTFDQLKMRRMNKVNYDAGPSLPLGET